LRAIQDCGLVLLQIHAGIQGVEWPLASLHYLPKATAMAKAYWEVITHHNRISEDFVRIARNHLQAISLGRHQSPTSAEASASEAKQHSPSL
jgi:hypothetical protein